MKLRIRSLKTKETTRIEVPNDCSVQQLKELICSRIVTAPPISSDELFVSLNRNNELSGSSLQSVGVTSGDLLFYTVKFSDSIASSSEPMDEKVNDTVKSSVICGKPRAELGSGLNDQSMEMDAGDGPMGGLVDDHKGKGVDLSAEVGETETLNSVSYNSTTSSQEFENSVGMVEGCQVTEVVYAAEVDEDLLVDTKSSFSVPSFLRKVFENEVGGVSSGINDHKLMVVAVHAALMESGFVGYDPILKKTVDGFRFPDQWPFRALYYTTPEVLSLEEQEMIETIVLKFQSMGSFLNVIGSSSKKEFLYRICLDGSRFTPVLNCLWWNGDSTDEKDVSGEEKLRLQKEVFELWKTVKDGLALPLLIDVCENAGLAPPSCFMQLPTEIKLNILEMLPGADIAKVACTCSELRFLSSNDDLWRQKYKEEFGGSPVSLSIGWKDKFLMCWNSRKKIETARSWRSGYRNPLIPSFGHPYPIGPIVRRDPILPFGGPYPMRGSGSSGEYGLPQMIGLPFQNRGRSFSPSCNFGRRH